MLRPKAVIFFVTKTTHGIDQTRSGETSSTPKQIHLNGVGLSCFSDRQALPICWSVAFWRSWRAIFSILSICRFDGGRVWAFFCTSGSSQNFANTFFSEPDFVRDISPMKDLVVGPSVGQMRSQHLRFRFIVLWNTPLISKVSNFHEEGWPGCGPTRRLPPAS